MISRYLSMLTLVAALLLLCSVPLRAQEVEMPELPAPLQNLAAEGAQVRYLGKHQGLDGWITIKRGQEQYFYVTPDGKGIVMGLLFDDSGTLLTAQQVQDLQGQGDELLDMLAEDDRPASRMSEVGKADNKELRTPSEKLYASVTDSNWVGFGNNKAPFIYVFVDPNCPHCKSLLNDLKQPYIDTGKLQVRLIPVGFSEEAVTKAAFLLAAPNAEERWYAHASGDKTALPAKKGINTQAVQMNLGLVQAWKFDATPITIYRDATGQVKIMRGRANDIHALFADVAG